MCCRVATFMTLAAKGTPMRKWCSLIAVASCVLAYGKTSAAVIDPREVSERKDQEA